MKGLVLEGGAMRGLFTAGVLDVLMENNIVFDGMIGVSAGAVFGCNFKSGQIGRVIRYNKRFSRDPRYAGLGSLLKTGDLYNAEFCYRVVPNTLDPFDTAAFRANPMEFIVTATDVETGKAAYALCEYGDAEDIEWMRASASMPLAAGPVKIGSREYLDGGIADSIPIRYMENRGYDRNVIILTQPADYRKHPIALMPIMRVLLRRYPAMLDTMQKRHLNYNETLDYIRERESAGMVFVIRPKDPLNIGKFEHNASKMEAVYQIGRNTAERIMDELKDYLL